MKVGFYVQQFESIGAEYVSACLKQAGHETTLWFNPRLYDDTYVHNERLAKLLDVEDMLVDEILESDVDVLAFSVVTDNYRNAARVAQKVRKHRNIPTVFGGVHVTSVPEVVTADPAVDYAVSGEGEYAMVDLVNSIAAGDRHFRIPNVSYMDNGTFISEPARPTIADLDELPFPDKEVWFDNVPKTLRKRYHTTASRGCVYACTFCNNSMYKRFYKGKGKWMRRRSVDSTIAELKWAQEKFGFESVLFWDEIFIDKADWLEEFADKYAREVAKPFACWAYPKFIDQRVIGLLEQAGCRQVCLGIQTVNQDTRRKVFRRGESNEHVVRAIDLMSKSSVFLMVDNIINGPGQSSEEALENVRFYTEHTPDAVMCYFMRYYPRTDIVHTAREHGILSDEEVQQIERGEFMATFQKLTDGDESGAERLRTLYYLTTILPRPLMRRIVEKGWYRFIPAFQWSSLLMLLGMWVNRWTRGVTCGKRRFVFHYTLYEFTLRIGTYALKKLRWKLRSRPTSPISRDPELEQQLRP
jgi:radical SAM superfamily enzyme YgiQ (UPF0313 family)